MGLATSNILDPNLPTSFMCIKVLQEPTIFLSNINIDIRGIYTSLNAIKIKLHFWPSSSQKKKTRLIGYKYIMISSNQRFTIFLIYCIYIFKASFFRILLYFFSLKRYLFKHQIVHTSTRKDLLQVLATSHLCLPSTKYNLSTTLARENGWDC